MQISSFKSKDNFIYKQIPPNFSGRADVHRKITNFTADYFTLSQERKLSVKNIEKLVQKYIPAVKVVLSKTKKQSEMASCSFVPKFDAKTNKYFISSHFITIPQVSLMKKSVDNNLTENIIHEMTHAFQNTDKDLSLIKLLNNQLNKIGNEQTFKTHIISSSTVKAFEENYVAQALSFLECPEYIPESCLENREALFQLCNPKGINFKNFFKERINISSKLIKEEFPDFEIGYFLKNLKNLAITEEDAYREGITALKSETQNQNLTISDVLPMLYAKLSEAINEINLI